jgi:cytochrome c556
MARKRAIELAVGAVMLAVLGGAAYAQADAITARQAFMKSLPAKTQAVRGADPAAAKQAAIDINNGFKALASQFPPGSDSSAGKTRAKAEIWSDSAGFKAAADRAVAASGQLVSAINSGDPAQVTTAAGALTQTCAGCHGAYRGPAVP